MGFVVVCMAIDRGFILEVEGRLFVLSEQRQVGEGSFVSDEEVLGRVSISSRDIELSDEEVFELLDTAHARQSFLEKFVGMHDKRTGLLSELGVGSGERVVFGEDVWVRCKVPEDYLSELAERDGGVDMLVSLCEFDTVVDTNAGFVVREKLRE